MLQGCLEKNSLVLVMNHLPLFDYADCVWLSDKLVGLCLVNGKIGKVDLARGTNQAVGLLPACSSDDSCRK